MKNYKMWIGGEWVDAVSGKTYTAVNPATGEPIASIPLGDKADVDKAVAAARKAYAVWSKVPQSERCGIMLQIASALKKRVDELVEVEILDHATPVKFAKNMAAEAGTHFEYAAMVTRGFWSETVPVNRNHKLYLQREPRGVCAAIVPWNTPIPMSTQKLSGSLSTGNACVLKPPSVDSLPSLKLAEIIEDTGLLPKGLLNVVTGPGGVVGEALASHPGVNMVSFTGSCEVGKRIMSCASATVKHLGLELGGKNPFIVFEDVDVDAVVAKAVFASTLNSGMVCASPGRYYLHEKIHDEFVEKFVKALKNVVVGDPNDEKTDMGPVVSAEHRDRVEYYIKKGIEEGANLLLGGKRPTQPPLNKGFFVMPTVFTGITPEMTIYREEIFGPVACIVKPFKTEEEVIAAANDNTFGLGASVWAGDTGRAMRVANEIEAGTVWINDHMFIAPDLPWGGFKESGLGKEGSVLGILEYTQLKVVSVNLNK
ncbi:MAG: aldehyde dehydrogenase family protein [Dehalococcoidales bacterium]|jgi:acyl-CoA reductase-like NAD-dependent aldehyde dehydrogenase